MRKLISVLGLAVLLAVRGSGAGPGRREPPPKAAEAAFGSDCEALLLRQIGRASNGIHVAIYCMTRESIADALEAAVQRGVDVQLKFDAGQARDLADMGKLIKRMRKAGVVCTGIRKKADKAVMHHKFTVIDGNRVLTGSYNYTTFASERNNENLLMIESETIAAEYLAEFERIGSR